MSVPLRIFLVLVSIFFLIFVLLMVRRDRFLLKYSIVWVALAILGVLAAVFPDGVGWLSTALGFETPVNFIFLMCILLLMAASLVFVAALSRQALLIKKLVQEMSILEARNNRSVKPRGKGQQE